MRIALAQLTATTDPQENLALVTDFASRAAREGAELVVLPEATMCSFRKNPAKAAEPVDGPWASAVQALAAELGVVIAAGMFTAAPDGRVRNTLLVTGKDRARYDKIHLFDALGQRESDRVAPGDRLVVAEVAGERLGLAICYDVRFPAQFTELARRGARAMLVCASWAPGPGKVHQWRTLVTARAMDSVSFVVAVDQAGPAEGDGLPTGVGHSMVVDPSGRVLLELGEQPDLAVVDLDLALADRARERLPVLADDPSRYTDHSVKAPDPPRDPGRSVPAEQPGGIKALTAERPLAPSKDPFNTPRRREEGQKMTTHDMRAAFMAEQRHLLAALEVVPEFTDHGTTIGGHSEANWMRVLREFLPARYGVAKGHVMDSEGNQSEQIDLLIYDRLYTPRLAQTANGDLFVPTEAVYAVFEVKQEANKEFMDYAGKKIASVRRLRRTSAEIPYAAGSYDAKEPVPILGGLLTTRSGWAGGRKESVVKAIAGLEGDRRIDIGCALGGFAFNVPPHAPGNIEFSDRDVALLFFLFKLFARLQALGTVAAVDIEAYMGHLGLGQGRAPGGETGPEK